MGELTWLAMYNNQISDISSLSSNTKLSTLTISNNNISDISSINSLANLSELYLYGNQIIDISSLALLPKLIVINLGENEISDIRPLVENENLGAGSFIDLRGNPLSEESVNIFIPQLIDRGVTLKY